MYNISFWIGLPIFATTGMNMIKKYASKIENKTSDQERKGKICSWRLWLYNCIEPCWQLVYSRNVWANLFPYFLKLSRSGISLLEIGRTLTPMHKIFIFSLLGEDLVVLFLVFLPGPWNRAESERWLTLKERF